MTSPDRMVVMESIRTFTYLNLYGYLTDAMVVNRVLPRRPGGLLRRLAKGAGQADGAGPLGVRAGADPQADYLEREVTGPEMGSIAWPADLRGRGPGRERYEELSQELVTSNGRATLRVDVPFANGGSDA